MVILELSSLSLGRFRVHDNFAVEEVLFTPFVDDAEVAELQAMLQRKAAPTTPAKETVEATLITLFGIQPDWIDWHTVNEPPLQPTDLPPEDV